MYNQNQRKIPVQLFFPGQRPGPGFMGGGGFGGGAQAAQQAAAQAAQQYQMQQQAAQQRAAQQAAAQQAAAQQQYQMQMQQQAAAQQAAAQQAIANQVAAQQAAAQTAAVQQVGLIPTTPTPLLPTTTESNKPLQVKPIVAPLCILKKGTTKGETIVTNVQTYTCPEGTSIYCSNEFSLQKDGELTIGCEWKMDTPQPEGEIPLPMCKPNEARTIYTNTCKENEITEQICDTGECVRQAGPLSDCLCPNENDISEIICRLVDDRESGETTGMMNCEEYGAGYEVGCPDGYTLNDTGDMCNLIM